MIARHEAHMDKTDLWAKLSAPLPAGVIEWRQDGKPTQRDGRYFARFVAYVEANTVRERLDLVCPGEWDLTLTELPTQPGGEAETICAFKARLQILGVIREDVGHGKDWKQASTDAFKRAAVRFGIAHELYAMEQNWVQVDGDGKFAKPLEDPGQAYARRYGSGASNGNGTGAKPAAPAPAAAPARVADTVPATAEEVTGAGTPAGGEPVCPKCSGKMWSNVQENNERAARGEKLRPDYKCRDRSCDGVIWRPKESKGKKDGAAKEPISMGDVPGLDGEDDELAY